MLVLAFGFYNDKDVVFLCKSTRFKVEKMLRSPQLWGWKIVCILTFGRSKLKILGTFINKEKTKKIS